MSGAGYFASPWPGEDGTPDRLQQARAPLALGLGPGKRLRCTSRRVFMGTMTVLRSPGEVYLLSHSMLRNRLFGLPTTACVERIDPHSLRAIARSPRLPGGPAWPGGMAVHRNGDLYVVYGRWCHRLAPDCGVRAALRLPADRPYNSFVILDNGLLVTKDFAEDGVSSLVLIDPESMTIIGEPLAMPEASIARLSACGDTVYVVGVRSIFRYQWSDATRRLQLDPAWRFHYLRDARQSYGWDPVLDGRDAWFMDNGKHRYFNTMRGAGVSPTASNLVRVSLADATDHEIVPISGLPGGSITNPPLVDPGRGIVMAYDSANAVARAWRIDPVTRALAPLWHKEDFGCASHMILFPGSGEVLTNDYRRGREHAVILDITSGEERARVQTGWFTQGVVFPGTGWEHDAYYVTPDTVARIWAD